MISIAIDGPGGAGKSTLSRLIAERLGYIYADTGAMYRAAALWWVRTNPGVMPASDFAFTMPLSITIRFIDGVQHVFLNEEDVSDKIRSPEISQMASRLSALPAVRALLLETQRNLAKDNNIIMDGRDIGTVVLPDAPVKIFLTAAPEDRARRRFEELAAKGVKTDFETVLREINERDERDTNRAAAPLRPASDAKIIDTTGDVLEESLETIESYIRERLAVCRDI